MLLLFFFIIIVLVLTYNQATTLIASTLIFYFVFISIFRYDWPTTDKNRENCTAYKYQSFNCTTNIHVILQV